MDRESILKDLRKQFVSRVVESTRAMRRASKKKPVVEERLSGYESGMSRDVSLEIEIGNYTNLDVQVRIKGKEWVSLDGDRKEEVLSSIHNPIRRLKSQVSEIERCEKTSEDDRKELEEKLDEVDATSEIREELSRLLDGDAGKGESPDYDGAILFLEELLPEQTEDLDPREDITPRVR